MSNIRQYLSSVATPTENEKFTNAFYDALDEAIAHAESMIESSQDQFFLNTADPEYLFKLAARSGFTLPRNSGLNIDGFRPLAPVMIYRPKNVLDTLIQILEIYFSPTLVRPNIISGVEENYSLDDGDDLIIRTRRGEVTVTVDANAFSDVNNVSASELASYLNFSQDLYQADVFLNRSSGKNFIRLISRGYGPGEIIQVIGGTLQNLLQFPNVVPTTNTAGTRWVISKPTSYSDLVTFTYQSGPVPNVFEARINDYVTIRNMFNVSSTGLLTVPVLDQFGNQVVDGNGDPVVITISLSEGNYSVLNGSFQVVDVGYDYFTIRAQRFLSETFSSLPVNGLWQELSPNDIVFTENYAHRITDLDQFALITEAQSSEDTLIVTVPAVPPIIKRYLQGAWHIQGVRVPIVDFNRTSVKFDLSNAPEVFPSQVPFVIGANSMSLTFNDKYFKTTSATGDTYNVNTSSSTSVFPYTQTTNLGPTDPFHCELDSNIVTATFSYPHGMKPGWEISLVNATLTNGFSVNGNHIVIGMSADNKLTFKTPTVNSGQISVDTASLIAINNTSFYLQFPSGLSVTSAGLQVGKKFKLVDNGSVTYVNYPIFQELLNRALVPTSISGGNVYFSIDFPVPMYSGTVASGVQSRTATTFFGGASSVYYFDKTSTINLERVMNGLNAVIYYAVTSSNPDFVGSFIWDPFGQYYRYVVGRIGSTQTSPILKGESGVIVPLVSGANFPSSGYVVFDYGTDKVEGPVRYLSINSSQMVIDPAYVFKQTHDIGSTVRHTPITQAYSPRNNGLDYQAFVTGTSEARDTVFALIEKVISAGVFVEKDVLLPDLRYADVTLSPYK